MEYCKERKQDAPKQAADAAHDYLMLNLKRIKHWSKPVRFIKLRIKLKDHSILPPLDVVRL
jgi:hypothetical protein